MDAQKRLASAYVSACREMEKARARGDDNTALIKEGEATAFHVAGLITGSATNWNILVGFYFRLFSGHCLQDEMKG